MATTYHLWLKPSGPSYETLAGLIRDLAGELRTPMFEPHVTLLGQLEGSELDHIQRTTRLGGRLEPFRIGLGAAAYRSEHFKCLFLRVAESAPVMNANVAALEVFQRAREEYMPHLSLVYGTLPEERKKQIIAALPALAEASFPVRGVSLIRADSEDPKDWREILNVPLRGRAAGD